MKVLLINPVPEPDIDTNLPRWVDQSRGALPPLGLLYLASSVRQAGHDVRVVDCGIEDIVVPVIAGFQPDFIGITATTFTLLTALRIAQDCRKLSTAKIGLGGVHTSIYPYQTLRACPEVDYVFSGEGEKCLPEMLKRLSLNIVPARGVFDAGGFIENLDELPFPDRMLTDWKKYRSAVDGNGYVTTIMTSRGCPYHCVFCHRPHMGRRFRARSPENVLMELRQIKRLGIDEVTFYDDTFAVDRERVVRICEMILREKLDLRWDIRTRVNLVDKDLLRLLRKAGCKQARYGIEASSNRVLREIGKGITIEQAEEAVRWTKQAGIETFAYFIIGSPGETERDWAQTAEFARKLNPDYCHFAIMTPYPSTPLYSRWLSEAPSRNDHWLRFAQNPVEFEPPYYLDWMPRELLESALRDLYRSFYLRPSYVAGRILRVRSAGEVVKKAQTAWKLVLSR